MPPLLGNRYVRFVTRIVTGGLAVLAAAGVGGLSATIIGGNSLPDFTTAGLESPSRTYVSNEEANVFVTATGGLKVSGAAKYSAACIPNPLARLTPSQGSGVVIRLSYENITNPSALSGDIGFVKDCGSGTGTTFVNNTCTATGCVDIYTAGTALWNGADFIKFGTIMTVNSAFSARIRLLYEDIAGE